ncbi:MAG TPA: O-antigen ligase family protein [Terriglobales bacterium]|nr:O-antigen ligase family protein [Terriglobales bacterium]
MRAHKFWRAFAIILTCAFALYLIAFRPGYFTDPIWLGALVFLQVLAAILVKYCEAFFPTLVLVFLFAGSAVPAHELWTSVRWLVLAAGAVAGLIVWLRCNHLTLGALHLIALACVLTAIVSALVSTYPDVALLKALSLLLLFVYAVTGGRVALAGREQKFLAGLLFGCEALVYISTVAYFVLHVELFGNRNSLGVAMGVVALPFLLWGLVVSDSRSLRRRRIFALLLCQLLLLASYERAGITAALTSSALLCLALRRYRLICVGLLIALITAAIVATVVPLPTVSQADDGSLTSRFVYKGKREAGVLASRKSVWQKTISSLEEHPWLGSGFGTSATAYDKTPIDQKFSSAGQVTREHGNSYLEIAEWVGLIGVVPFAFLLLLIMAKVARVCAWIHQTGVASSPAVPLAAFVAGALVHAGFEDWLFAVGYHTCVLFWVFAFMLADFVPARTATRYLDAKYPSTIGNPLGALAGVQTCTFSSMH